MRFILAGAVCVGSAFGALLVTILFVRVACMASGVSYDGEARVMSLVFGLMFAPIAALIVGISEVATETADAIIAKMRRGHRETRV